MVDTIKVNYKYTSIPYIAKQWLDSTPQVAGYDFETTGLGHPSKEQVTHLAVGISPTEGFVLIINSAQMLKLVMTWLVTTDKKQVWHNASYDFKFIWYHTGKFPKDYEDSAMLAKCILNHVETYKAKVGLKELMGQYYGDWAVSSDYFNIDNLFNEKLIEYAATDGAATIHLWQNMQTYLENQLPRPQITTDDYSPWDLLPAVEPRLDTPFEWEFYEKVVKHLIKDTVRIMMNGIPIDLTKVAKLETTLDEVLASVQKRLTENPLINEFQQNQHITEVQEYIRLQKLKRKPSEHFIKDFDHKKMEHRSYFMYAFCQDHPLPIPSAVLPIFDVPKWTANDVKRIDRPILKKLIDGSISPNNKYVKTAMQLLAEHKAEIYNKRYDDKIDAAPDLEIAPFNPASAPQKQALFNWLGIESEKTSKDTGLPSFDRDEIERINNETDNEDIKDFTQSFIDHSFGAIVKNNFVKAFYNYTIDNHLYGQIKLFGAKSFRLTSSDPNLLNMPSTRSIYSKPVKKCFVAPPGYVVLGIDYGALEDRVIASLTRDKNKCAVFLDGLDGHSLNAYGYFKDEVAQHMSITGDVTTDVKEMYRLVEDGHKELKAIRQKGKPATFGLSYGAYPPKVSRTLKISLPAAQSIFNSYHNELYAGITDYRENYVLPTANTNGKIHCGLGCYLKTDDAGRDIRTLNNATCQFWSILTLLTINKMHQLIDKAGYQDDVICISTIYDSIYFIVKEDAEILKWTNDNLVACMTKDFMFDQTIKNEATAEIGYDWSTMSQIKNGASVADIEAVLTTLKDNK